MPSTLCCVVHTSQQPPVTHPLSRHNSPWSTHGIWTHDSQQDKRTLHTGLWRSRHSGEEGNHKAASHTASHLCCSRAKHFNGKTAETRCSSWAGAFSGASEHQHRPSWEQGCSDCWHSTSSWICHLHEMTTLRVTWQWQLISVVWYCNGVIPESIAVQNEELTWWLLYSKSLNNDSVVVEQVTTC